MSSEGSFFGFDRNGVCGICGFLTLHRDFLWQFFGKISGKIFSVLLAMWIWMSSAWSVRWLGSYPSCSSGGVRVHVVSPLLPPTPPCLQPLSRVGGPMLRDHVLSQGLSATPFSLS